jgi:hypothetical protein
MLNLIIGIVIGFIIGFKVSEIFEFKRKEDFIKKKEWFDNSPKLK